MPMIRETIVTTFDAEGVPHISPIGLIEDGDLWTIAPFRPSKTLTNLLVWPRFVANHTDDARYYAGLVTGRRDWALVPTHTGFPPRLANALAHWELEVTEILDDLLRPRFTCQVRGRGIHSPFCGHNRAFAAVVEASILVSRLAILDRDIVKLEILRLQTVVYKTAGWRETEAFRWLEEKIGATD